MRKIPQATGAFAEMLARDAEREPDVFGSTGEVIVSQPEPPASTPKPQRALTDEEVLLALERLGEAFRPTVAFTETGLRISEVLALRWEDVDLQEASLVVRSTKTKTEREIGISDAAMEVLREHRRRMRSSQLVGITAIAPDALVFQTRTGRPQSRRNVLRAWQDALAEVGIHDAGLHTLRHSFISRLEERGITRGDRRRACRPFPRHDDAGGLHADARRP